MSAIPDRYAPPPDLLQGRTVLVTGATGGLGRATALACGRHGASVILLGRSVPKLEGIYDAIRGTGGPEPAIYPLNLAGATWSDYEQLAATLQREFGALDGLAHCAAHFKGFTPIAQVDPADWLESLQVNVTAPFALTRHCLPLLQKSGRASVVFVSDASGRRGAPYAGAYGVSKFALEGLAQIFALELDDPRVRVNTLDPGPLDTALRRRGYANAAGARDPADAVPALLWLLGPDSAATTGAALSLRRWTARAARRAAAAPTPTAAPR